MKSDLGDLVIYLITVVVIAAVTMGGLWILWAEYNGDRVVMEQFRILHPEREIFRACDGIQSLPAKLN